VTGQPPPLNKLLREGLGLADLAASWARPAVKVAGAGQGQPVMVIPGMMSGDETVRYLRRSLAASGFAPHASGIMFHAVASAASVGRAERQLERNHQDSGQKVVLLGWSLGGLYARALAHRHPHLVSAVVTLGAPFSGDMRANNAWKLYEAINRGPIEAVPFDDPIAQKPPVPTVAVWSTNDGIIAPAAARGQPDESDRQVEVSARHLDLASNRACVRRVIEVLAEVLD